MASFLNRKIRRVRVSPGEVSTECPIDLRSRSTQNDERLTLCCSSPKEASLRDIPSFVRTGQIVSSRAASSRLRSTVAADVVLEAAEGVPFSSSNDSSDDEEALRQRRLTEFFGRPTRRDSEGLEDGDLLHGDGHEDLFRERVAEQDRSGLPSSFMPWSRRANTTTSEDVLFWWRETADSFDDDNVSTSSDRLTEFFPLRSFDRPQDVFDADDRDFFGDDIFNESGRRTMMHPFSLSDSERDTDDGRQTYDERFNSGRRTMRYPISFSESEQEMDDGRQNYAGRLNPGRQRRWYPLSHSEYEQDTDHGRQTYDERLDAGRDFWSERDDFGRQTYDGRPTNDERPTVGDRDNEQYLTRLTRRRPFWSNSAMRSDDDDQIPSFYERFITPDFEPVSYPGRLIFRRMKTKEARKREKLRREAAKLKEARRETRCSIKRDLSELPVAFHGIVAVGEQDDSRRAVLTQESCSLISSFLGSEERMSSDSTSSMHVIEGVRRVQNRVHNWIATKI